MARFSRKFMQQIFYRKVNFRTNWKYETITALENVVNINDVR